MTQNKTDSKLIQAAILKIQKVLLDYIIRMVSKAPHDNAEFSPVANGT